MSGIKLAFLVLALHAFAHPATAQSGGVETTPRLVVRVVTAAGEPVLRGRVKLYANTLEGEKSAVRFLDNDPKKEAGTVEFDTILAGEYFISAVAPEGMGWMDFVREKQPEGGEPVLLRLKDAKSAIRGKVRVGGKTPAKSIWIMFYFHLPDRPRTMHSFIPLEVFTDQHGAFELKHLVAGKYQVRVDHPSAAALNEVPLILAEAEQREFEINLAPPVIVTLKGTVKDLDGRGIGGSRIHAEGVRGFTLTTSSRASGEFELPVAVPPDYPLGEPWRVSVHQDGYTPGVQMAMVSGDETRELAFTLSQVADVRVEIFPADDSMRTKLTGPLEIDLGTYGPSIGVFGRGGSRHSAQSNGECWVIEKREIWRGLPADFSIGSKESRGDGQPIWLRNGQEVARGSYVIPNDDPATFTVRIPIVAVEPDRVVFMRLIDARTGAPVDGVRVTGAEGHAITLPDGRCRVTVSRRNGETRFDCFVPLGLTSGRLAASSSDAGSIAAHFPISVESSAERPVEVRGVRFTQGRSVRVVALDGFGNDISDRIAAEDDGLIWQVPDFSEQQGSKLLMIPDTGVPIRNLILKMKHGGKAEFQLVDSESTGVSLGRTDAGEAVLRLKFDEIPDHTGIEARVRITNQLILPGLDHR